MTSNHTSSIHSWYTFDELDLQSISEVPAVAGDKQEIKSTPTKPRNASHLYTHQSVDLSILAELERSRYSGISFEKFLQCAFEVSDEEMIALKKRVREISAHTSKDYELQSKEFVKHAENWETKMYKPFAEMGNMVLNAHQEKSGNRIKVHPSTGNEYVKGEHFAKRKPDVSLVPEKDGGKEIDSKSLRWYHMLCVLEFKKGSSGPKHAREDEEDGGEPFPKKHISTTLSGEPDPVGAITSGTSASNGQSGTATRTSTGAEVSFLGSSSRAKTTSQSSAGAKASGTGSSSRLESAAMTSTGARVVDVVSSTSSLRNFATSSTRTSTPANTGASIEDPPPLRRSPRFALTSQPSTLPEPMGPPAPITQVSNLSTTDNQPTNPTVMLDPSADDGEGEDGESLSAQGPQDASNTAETRASSGGADGAEVQLANYAIEMMSVFSDRTFTFGAIVKQTSMQLTYYSRSLYAISDDINIIENPVMFAVFLCLFAKQPLDKLGYSTDLGYRNPFNSKKVVSNNLGSALKPINGGDNYAMNPGTKLKFGERIHTEYCLMGRATTIFDVKRPKGCEIDLVAKVQSQPKSRRREDHAILIAREVDAEHSPEIYGVAILEEKSPSESFKSACSKPPKHEPEARELRVLLMRKYNPVEELEDDDFIDLIPQFATCAFSHRSRWTINGLTIISIDVHALYSERELLHRDISIGNMAYYVKNGKKIAALIDFDLATFPIQSPKLENPARLDVTEPVNAPSVYDAPASPCNATTADGKGNNDKGHERSGTTPFMAIETLDLNLSPYVHHVCHELESLFYASVWHGVGYRWTKGIYPYASESAKKKKNDILRGWRMGTWEQVVIKKNSFLLDAKDTLRHVKHLWLKQTCWNLALLFRQRIEAVRNWDWNMEVAAESAAQGQQGAKLRVMSVVHQPIFPTFADMWGFERVACQKSCCVINTPKRP